MKLHAYELDFSVMKPILCHSFSLLNSTDHGYHRMIVIVMIINDDIKSIFLALLHLLFAFVSTLKRAFPLRFQYPWSLTLSLVAKVKQTLDLTPPVVRSATILVAVEWSARRPKRSQILCFYEFRCVFCLSGYRILEGPHFLATCISLRLRLVTSCFNHLYVQS